MNIHKQNTIIISQSQFYLTRKVCKNKRNPKQNNMFMKTRENNKNKQTHKMKPKKKIVQKNPDQHSLHELCLRFNFRVLFLLLIVFEGSISTLYVLLLSISQFPAHNRKEGR